MLVVYVKIVVWLFEADRSSCDKVELGLKVLASCCRCSSTRVPLAVPGLDLSQLKAASDA